jgi:transketolase
VASSAALIWNIHKKAVLGRRRARVAIAVAVDLGWERYIGLEGRFVGVGTASAPQAKSPKFKNRHQRRCGRER